MSLTAQRGFLEFSPIRGDGADKENDVPVLTLIQFSKAPFVGFGTVKIGTSKSAVLRFDNPTVDVEAEVHIEKIASNKGFCVDHNTFTIEPEGSFNLTITWTPTEEGGVRELLVITANGVLKHQAVLLGRADAPKKKKKTLWDSIKNKPGVGKVSGHKANGAKMSANKTFQVARKSQYKRDKPRSPLASLNQMKPTRERSLSKKDHVDQHPQKQSFMDSAVQDYVCNMQQNSPLAYCIPPEHVKHTDGQGFLTVPENRDLIKVLNKTLSPIGTPDRLKKLMPRIESVQSPVVRADANTEDSLNITPNLSIRDALALIGSDLSPISSSPQGSSTEFSDSLESKSGNLGKDVINSESPEINEPRLTFFVSKKVVLQEVKMFTSTTVTKGRAPVEMNPLSGRKIKKSRRRLLERTLTDSSGQSESHPETPCLPVIEMKIDCPSTTDNANRHSDAREQDGLRASQERTGFSPPGSPAPFTLLVPSPQCTDHGLISMGSPSAGLPANVTLGLTTPPKEPSPPIHQRLMTSREAESVVSSKPEPFLASSPESFPVHLAIKSKKRKSDEFLKADVKAGDAVKTEKVKRSRVAAVKCEPSKGLHERRPVSSRPAGSVRSVSNSSLKSVKSVAPAQTKLHSSKSTIRSAPSLKSSTQKARVVAVAQSKLTFIKPAQTAIPRHPMPFAAKNMFFDERWIEKQERGFTWWINYVLTPDDFKVNTEVTKVNAVSLAMGTELSVPKAPTKEEMSFSTYTARRKLNRLRRSACQLFTSELMVKAIQRLELEVEAKRLLVRKDRHLWKDIGERQKVLNWLLSYNPLWLRIGLETIYGELISLENNGDTFGLAMFILQRLLWNPDIAAQFRHPKVPHLYRDGHEEALSRFTLKKLLLLVCFLDKAKESRLIEHDPCLFCMDAEFKTSKDLLLAFSRDFLSGEGILPRHLGYLGLPVSHEQKPLDEFNFAVKNLAVDLKCGIRLVRVMELLVQDWSLSPKLRLPAISRLQKVHNVDIALQVLKKKGVDLKDENGSAIDSRDIVDGHREKTLSLLWKIIFAFHVEIILNEDQLKEEIGFLRKTWRTKRRLACLRKDRGIQPSPAKDKASVVHCSPKFQMLMDWVRAVGDFYNLNVENFTVSFSDGRVLCYLIHHYHPSLVPEHTISHSTTQTVDSSPRGRLELNCSASDSDNSFDSILPGSNASDSPFKELLENEKNNFRLVNSAVAFLGGVPAMITAADMSNTIPNEKVVMSYLSFLCTRLLDLRNETRAARVIQAAWRIYRLKKDLQLYQERNEAAMKIQSHVRKFLQRRRAVRQKQAAILIQAVWRGFMARQELKHQKEARLWLLKAKAAVIIQSHWRMFCTMKSYQRLRYYAIVVQAQWRMRTAATAYGRTLWAVSIIQKYTRAWSKGKKQRECYLHFRSAAVKIQRGYRCWKAQKTEKENHAAHVIQAAFRKWYEGKISEKLAASVKIQSWYRMHLCQSRYKKIKKSAVLIQAQYRGYVQRQCYQMLKLQHYSATVIQCVFRGYILRKQVIKQTLAAIVIQQHFRASLKRNAQRHIFLRERKAAITLQAAYRGKLVRGLLKMQHKAATVIQTAFRRYVVQKRYHVMRKAAISIQQKYRATCLANQTQKDFMALRHAAVRTQAIWRGRVERKTLAKETQCATIIQAWFRRHVAYKSYKSTKASALVIQQYFRAYVAAKEARKVYLETRAATVTLQAAFRGMMVRKDLHKRHKAATVLQSYIRMRLQKKRYGLLQYAAIIIQSRYRALLASREQQYKYRQLMEATLKIQAFYRGFLVRNELKRQQRAATVIQAHFRMHQMRMTYLATKCAAILIQDRYRAKIMRDQQVQKFRAMKCAAVTIQAVYRGYKVRKVVKEMQRAAIVIQRAYSTYRIRNQFVALKKATLYCQRLYRAVAVARAQRRDYLMKLKAVICLQAIYRGYTVRREVKRQHYAATVIQASFRMHQMRMTYLAMKCAAIMIQERYRAKILRDQQVRKFRAMKCAAVTIQAAYRGYKVRQEMTKMQQAATVIQRAFLAYQTRNQFVTLKKAALICQRQYRAVTVARAQRCDYLSKRNAVICLQAALKGYLVRKDLCKRHHAATIIQSHFRKCQLQTRFKKLRWAAKVVQARFRANQRMRTEVQALKAKRNAAVVLQAAFKGMRARQQLKRRNEATVVIQRAYKTYCQRKRYLALRLAAIIIQQRYRASAAAKTQRTQYLYMRRAAVALQAAYRGHQVRMEVALWHKAATTIQSAFRKHREEVKYQAMCLSAVIIQRSYRSWLLQRQVRANFLKARHSAIVLQAAFRGQQVRKSIGKMHRAATVIQANFRKHKQQSLFKRQLWATRVIQQSFRAQRQMKLDKHHYQQQVKAAIVLQAAYRGMKLRQNVMKMQKAAGVIQRAFKAHCQRKDYLRFKACVVAVQRRYRATVAAKKQTQQFLKIREAAVRLQAAYRGLQVRKKVACWHQAATVIQSAFRKHREEVKYQAMRLSAIIIQRRYRSWSLQRQEHKRFLKLRHSAVVLQAIFRGHCVRKDLAKMQNAATVIQTNFRRHVQQTSYRRHRWAACVFQQRFRAQRQMNLDRQNYIQQRQAVVLIQAAYRGMKSRQSISQMNQSACVIQRVYRAHCERTRYLSVRRSTLTIQRRYRATAAAKGQMVWYQKLRWAAVVFQAAFRGHCVRKALAQRHKASTVIQAAFRRHREEIKYQAVRLAAIIIQRHYRALVLQKRQRAKFLYTRHCAVVLQAAFRGRQVRQKISKMHQAATVIQANFRRHKQQSVFQRKRWAVCVLQRRLRAQRQMHFELQHFQKQRKSAIVLQAAYRGMKSRQNINQMHQAASVIQRAFKAHCQRKEYLTLKASVVAAQRRYRATVAAKKQTQQFHKMRVATVRLQAAYRGHQVRKKVACWHQAATVIQSAFRKHREEVKYQAMRLSAIIIQRHYRSRVLQRQEQDKFLKIKRSTIVLQAAFRGWQVRKDLAHHNGAAVIIQSHWRSFVQRRHFERQKHAILKIQRRVRALQLGRRQRIDYNKRRQAAIILQSHCRAWIARKQAQAAVQAEKRLRFSAAIYHHLNAIKIQRALRVHWALLSAKKQINSVITIQRWVRAWIQRRRYQEDKRKVVIVQRAVKHWFNRRQKAASVIQQAVRKFLLIKREKRVQRGIVKAQALWRGYRSRQLNDNSKVVKLRRRLQKVSAGVREEDRLCNKTTTALDYLLRYKHFSYILEALKNLETATRLSPECCVRLVESGATNVIFTLIRCCNRSVPCMEVITFSIQILLNLSKYHKTIEAVYLVENSVETLLDLLQRYREKAGDKVAEKGGSIFTKACFLLALLLQDKHRAVAVMKIPKALDRIQSIYRLTARKQKMDAERTVVKQKMNASINGSFFIQATPRKARPAPKFAPEWVLRKDKLKDIVDPLRAIQMVAETLSIVL